MMIEYFGMDIIINSGDRDHFYQSAAGSPDGS